MFGVYVESIFYTVLKSTFCTLQVSKWLLCLFNLQLGKPIICFLTVLLFFECWKESLEDYMYKSQS